MRTLRISSLNNFYIHHIAVSEIVSFGNLNCKVFGRATETDSLSVQLCNLWERKSNLLWCSKSLSALGKYGLFLKLWFSLFADSLHGTEESSNNEYFCFNSFSAASNRKKTSQIRNLMCNVIVQLRQYKVSGAQTWGLEYNFFLLVSLSLCQSYLDNSHFMVTTRTPDLPLQGIVIPSDWLILDHYFCLEDGSVDCLG